jgi:putative membrane protein
MKTTRTLLNAVLLAVLTVALNAACTREVSQQVHPRIVRPSPAAELASQDRDFLERAAEGNNAEVAIGSITKGHSFDARVLAYGQMLVSDHTAARSALETIAAKKQISLPTGLGEQQASYDQIEEKTRESFDRDFAKEMVGAHDQALELFKGEALNGVDPELKAYAAANVPVLEKHLDEAKALATALQAMSDVP